jgi:hypothetical protein
MSTAMPRQRRPFCHRLSGFLFERKSALSISGEMAEVKTMECAGSSCSAFVTGSGADGQPIGMCADTLQAISLSQIAALIAQSLDDGEGDEKNSTEN